MIPDVSIVLSCYQRAKQLTNTLDSIRMQDFRNIEVIVVEDGDDGQTQHIARRFGAKYFQKKRAELPAFQNPSRVHNIGIKQATAPIVILQGGEVKYKTPHTVYRIADTIDHKPCYASPFVESLDKDGKFEEWYCHPKDGNRAGWIINFCLAVPRQTLLSIGGFEESYTGYGFEDDQLMFSLDRVGLRALWVDDTVSHQWHERKGYNYAADGRGQFNEFRKQVLNEGRPAVANVGREWGRL